MLAYNVDKLIIILLKYNENNIKQQGILPIHMLIYYVKVWITVYLKVSK